MTSADVHYLPLGVLGFGNMGQAMISCLLKKQILSAEQIYIYDPEVEKQERAKELGLSCVVNLEILPEQCNSLLVAVKPQVFEAALQPIKGKWSKGKLLISIAAGVSINYIKNILAEPAQKVVRTMPNTPALVQAGITGICFSVECNPNDCEFVKKIFQSIGNILIVEEPQIDIITAVSGSGPAYYFYLSEAIIEAGKELGLTEEDADWLVRNTLYGAGLLLMSQPESPRTLRARVTSKGGTTESAISQLESVHFKDIVKKAVFSAFQRAKELGK